MSWFRVRIGARRAGRAPRLKKVSLFCSRCMSSSSEYDVMIAGGGPAGASAAIHLAARGARVLLAEQKKFPRAKLCGEFISPECTPHFERLGVAEQIDRKSVV